MDVTGVCFGMQKPAVIPERWKATTQSVNHPISDGNSSQQHVASIGWSGMVESGCW